MTASAHRAAAALAAAALLAVTLGACGPASGRDADASPVSTTTVDLPASYRFTPTAITVHRGATVTWTNSDHFTHSVRFLDGGLPTEPLLMEPGQSATFTFASAGTFRYQCHFHPQNMQGSVTVTG